MNIRQMLFRQLLELIPDLQEWSERAGRADGGNVPNNRTLQARGSEKQLDLEVEMVGGDSYQGKAWQCRLALCHSTKENEAGEKLKGPRMEVAISFEEREAAASTYLEARLWEVWKDGRRDNVLEIELSSLLSRWLLKAQVNDYKITPLVQEQQEPQVTKQLSHSM